MSENNNNFAKEIKAAARKEQIVQLLKKYKKLITTSISAFAICVILVISYNAYNISQSKKYSVLLHEAFVEEGKGNEAAALEKLKAIYDKKSAPKGIRSIASLRYAAILIKNSEKFDDAIAVYLDISKTNKYDPYVRELGGLIAIQSLISTDNKSYDEKINNILPGLEKNSKLLKPFLSEQKGIFKWNRSEFKEANEIFKALAGSPETPEQVKNRADKMVQIYKSRFGSVDEKPAEKIEEKSDQKAPEKENIEGKDNQSDKK